MLQASRTPPREETEAVAPASSNPLSTELRINGYQSGERCVALLYLSPQEVRQTAHPCRGRCSSPHLPGGESRSRARAWGVHSVCLPQPFGARLAAWGTSQMTSGAFTNPRGNSRAHAGAPHGTARLGSCKHSRWARVPSQRAQYVPILLFEGGGKVEPGMAEPGPRSHTGL